jgi:hypothetical protein
MFAGHLGAGLALARTSREVNVGAFIAAALLLDLLLWAFILLGWESVTLPANFSVTHQPEFDFPWTHGLVAATGWSLVAAAIAFAAFARHRARRMRVAAALAAAVFSHWLLDFVVHQPEMPMAGAASHRVGLGLWNHMLLAMALESVLTFAGLWLFLAGGGWPRGRASALALLVAITWVFTLLGMTVAPPPPSPFAMAASSLATLAVVCAFASWLGRRGPTG